MDELVGAEKAGLCAVLEGIINGILDSGGGAAEKPTLRVEEVDMGVLVYPDDMLEGDQEGVIEETVEEIAYPVYKEDLVVDAHLLADIIVRDVAHGLFSNVLIRLHINERREVVVQNKEVYEAEVLASEIMTVKQREECEATLEAESMMISDTLKVALEQIMREEKVGGDFDMFTPNQN